MTCNSPDDVWHSDEVTLHCTGSDDGTGLVDPGDSSFTVSTHVGDGHEDANAYTNIHHVCDLADNCADAGPIGPIKVDREPPRITITQGSSGAHVVVDDGGLGTVTCTVDGVPATIVGTTTDGHFEGDVALTPGDHDVRCTAGDGAGHTPSSPTTPVTGPGSVPGLPADGDAFDSSPDGDNGWFKTAPATATVHVVDASPTTLACTIDGDPVTITRVTDATGFHAVLSVSQDGIHPVACTATDTVGHTTSATTRLKLDTVHPDASIQSPAGGAPWFDFHQTVPAAYTCADDGGSGIASCTGDSPNGQPIDTSHPGEQSFHVTARDQAGNVTTSLAVYRVRTAGPQSLAGEGFSQNGPPVWANLDDALADCRADQPSTFSFDASGAATGPYVGTFTQHVTVSLSRQNVDGHGNWGSSLLFGTVLSIDATFTIHSGGAVITGHQHLSSVQHQTGLSLCQAFVDATMLGTPHATGDVALADSSVTWDAHIDDPAGTADDAGEGSMTVLQAVFHAGGAGIGSGAFFATFDSSGGLSHAPNITLTTPVDGATYESDQTILAAYTCSDAGSGVSACVGTVRSGDPIDVTPGTHSFRVTAVDSRGRSRIASATYFVRPASGGGSPSSSYADTVLADHPVSYWRLGDGADTGAMVDETGSHSGEYKNGAGGSLQQGISGDGNTVAIFAGNGTYGYVNGIQAPQHEYTMEAWVDPDDTGSAMIMQHGGGGALYIAGGRYAFRQVDTTITSTTGPTVGHFDHVVGTWDGATARLYVNSHLEASAPSTKPPSGAGTFYIGYGELAPWFRGYLDEAAYYPTALSAARVQAHFDADPPPPLWIPRGLSAAPNAAEAPTNASPATTGGDSSSAGRGSPPPAAGRKPSVAPTVGLASSRLTSKRGQIAVRVVNRTAKRVTARITLAAKGHTLGTQTAKLGPKAHTVRLTLTKSGRTLLKRQRSLTAKLTISTPDATQTATVTLR